MNFRIDENLPGDIAGLLPGAGHDVLTVLGQYLLAGRLWIVGEDDLRIRE